MWKWKKICAVLQTTALVVSVNPTAVSGLGFTTGVEAEAVSEAEELLTSAEDQIPADAEVLTDAEADEIVPSDTEADDMVPVEVAPEDLITSEEEPEEADLLVEEAETSVPEVGARAPHSDYHTMAEIRAFVKNHPIQYLPPAYTVEPLMTAPYRLGSLTAEVQQDALNALNVMRYIAGIPANVTIYDGYKEYAQGVTLANAVNDDLSHYPAKPQGMSDSMYKICSQGGSSTNIAMTSYDTCPTYSVIKQWMVDSGSNLADLGHRRWCLNPRMKRTAFGQTGNYTSMYSIDGGAYSATSYDAMWPGQMMPVDFFGNYDPWSYCTGDSETASAIKVTLKNQNTGKTWNFSQSSADGYFNVSSQGGMGLDGCIVFRPKDFTRTAGDVYEVTITGTSSGTISYTVTFFQLYERPITSVSIEGPYLLPYRSSAQYSIKVEPENTDEPKPTVIESENPEILPIDDNGVATGLTEDGSASLICRWKNTKYSKDVRIFVPVTSIVLDKTEITMAVDELSSITATFLPENAGLNSLTWTSDNDSVVRVYTDGSFYTRKAGTAILTCTNKTTGVSASCRVNVVVPVTGVNLNKRTLSLIKGQTETLNATVYPIGDKGATNTNVTWKSSNPSIASVDSNGKVTALAGGTCDITVTTEDGEKTATCMVTVSVPVTGVSLDKNAITMERGSKSTLTATIAPPDATNKNVTWSSSNTSVATVTSSGSTATITARRAGSCAITVRTANGGMTATCLVEVIVPVTGVTLNQTSLALTKGATSILTATVAPSDATDQSVTWTSSNTSVATVDANGKVTAKAAGSCNITVKTASGAKTAVCAITVTVPVTGVTLNKTTLSLNKGSTSTLTATVAPSDATNKSVTWTSSNTSVATVDANGKVTAKAAGNCSITVKTADGAKTAVCTVTVKVPVTGVTLNKTSLSLNKGGTSTLTATVAPSDATNKSVTWTSSNPSVATVDASGKVTAKAVGSCNITVKTADGAKSAVCAVTVTIPVTGVTLNKTSLTLTKGGTALLTATVAPSDATNKSLTWTSSDTSVASVDSTGKVTAKAAGSCSITVKTADGAKTAVCDVTVKVPVTGVTLNKTSLSLNKGATTTLTATIAPSDATNKSVTWTSSNTSVATVDSTGKVMAKAGGSCNITVKTADGAKTAVCAVTVKVPVTGVTLNKASLSLNKGGTSTLTATVAPSDATNKSVTWTSSNTSIATVDANGKVTAKVAGSCNITVKTADGAKTAVCAVTVKVPVTGVTLNKTSLTLNKGDTSTLTATISPSDATNKSLTWTSSDTAVATVDSTGKVTAKAGGSCDITVKTADGAKTAVCAVTVKVPVTGVTLNKISLSLNKGGTSTLTATVAPSDATNKSVTWTSSNTAVATVDANGKVTAKAAGSSNITVKTVDGAKTAVCAVTVKVPVTGVTLNKTSLSLNKGGSSTLTATIAPSDATNKSVTWTSSNTSVATVDANGKVTAKAGGSCSITAKTADGAKTAVCSVTVTVPVTAIKINEIEASVAAGSSVPLTTSITPADATDQAVTWSVSDEKTASVSSSGLVTGRKAGMVTVTVTTHDGQKQDRRDVRILFKDVTDGSKFYYDPVYWALDNGVTAGKTGDMFAPGEVCTRGQVVTFLWRASGSPKAGDVKNPFTDVIEGKYYYDAVLWAVGQGITAGTSATTFSPNDPCTRGQVATFLWRSKGKPAVSGTANPFTDVKPGKYYYDAVLWAVDQKITAGTTPTAFTPDGQCTRGHIVTFLYRAR